MAEKEWASEHVREKSMCVVGGGAERIKELIHLIITHFPQKYHRNHIDAFMTEHLEPSYFLKVLLVPPQYWYVRS